MEMSVYVDRLLDHGWRLGKSCHLTADSVYELRAFAASLGMRLGWEQVSRRGIVHYDLTAKRRVKAVSLGAIER